MPKPTQIATDPPVSEKQRRAMEAAAHGHSTLGIPKKVGEEFVGKDDDTDDEVREDRFTVDIDDLEPVVTDDEESAILHLTEEMFGDVD